MSSKRVCDKCGAALDATDGTCPACTMAAALDASTRKIQGAGFLDDLPVPAEPLIIADKYTVIKTIARGGMGIVYKARQENLNRIVAVKMLLSGFHASDELRQRFLREAKAAASLKHPNIVCIFDWGEDAGQPFFSMDYIEGQTLDALVRVRPLEPMAAAALMLTLTQAIQYAHQRGILHRDIKPSNIIVDGAGVPHITDFGLARQIHETTTLTAAGEFLGTPGYLPPEQMSAKSGTVGPHSDVYGLGAVLFHLVTGQAPFQAGTLLEMIQKVSDTEARKPSLLNPSVPRDLDTICLKCLSKDPTRRYATAEMLARDLRAYLEHEKIQARPLSALERVQRWCRQKPFQAAAALMLSLLVITAGTATFKWTQAVRQIRELETQAAAGDLRAQKVLGRVYEEGIGVKPDLDKAKEWAGLAAGQGDEESQARLDRLQGRVESKPPTQTAKVADSEAARNPTPIRPVIPPRSPVAGQVIVVNHERALPEAVAAASPQVGRVEEPLPLPRRVQTNVGGHPAASKGPKSISIVGVRTNEALRVKSEYSGKGMSIGQVVSALPEHLNAAFISAGKFAVIEPRDIGRVIEDNSSTRVIGPFDGNTFPKRGRIVVAQYEITVEISHFLDNEQESTFADGNRGYKREISLVGTIKIVNSETAEMVYSGPVKSEVKEATVLPAGEKLNGQQFEKLVPELMDDFSARTVQFTVEKLYPLKVFSREGNEVDINTDISSGLKVGEVLLAYGPERFITDEASGKTRKISGALIGKVIITLVDANECKGKVIEEKERGKVVPNSVLRRQDTGETAR